MSTFWHLIIHLYRGGRLLAVAVTFEGSRLLAVAVTRGGSSIGSSSCAASISR